MTRMTLPINNRNTPFCADIAIPSEWAFNTTEAQTGSDTEQTEATETDRAVAAETKAKETAANTTAAATAQTVSATAPVTPVNTGGGFPAGLFPVIILLLVGVAAALTGILFARRKKEAAKQPAGAAQNDRTDARE